MDFRPARRTGTPAWSPRLLTAVLLCVAGTVSSQDLPEAPTEASPTDASPPTAESEEAGSEEAESEAGEIWERISGYLRTRYVLRFTNDEEDHDIFQYGSINVGDPYKDRVTLSFFGSVIGDLDGDDEPIYSDIRNTWSGDVTGWLYHGWVDIHRLGPVERVRLGRQFTYDTPEFAYFDGASMVTRKWKDGLGLRGIAYAGVPVHPYESSRSDDMMVGVALESNPWRQCRLRLDWMHVRDDYVNGLEQDHLLAATFRQVLFDTTNLYARWTGFVDSNRDVTARVHHVFPDWDLDITASYKELFHTQRDRAIDFDYYYSTMRDYRPYRQGELRASKLFGEHFAVDAGFMVRELSLDGDESAYNHEFIHYFVYPSLQDWPVDGVDITLFADFWDAQGDDIYSIGGEVEFELRDSLKLSVGSQWELYRWDFFDDEERDRVRTYYARLSWDVNEYLSVRTRYEFEHSEFDDFHTFILDIKLNFGGRG